MLEFIKKKKGLLLFSFFSIIIFLFHIWYLREIRVPVIRNDEYGYWSHAALLSGHDWSEVLSNHMNWYSYGYSLILAPLFYLTDDLYIMYKTAIVFNGIFGVLTYLLCFLCARQLFPGAKKQILLTASFAVCMYSSYITQSQIAWSETFLYLMIWLLLYLFLRFERRPSTGSALALSACMGYCYIIHNRTIGIVTAYFLIVLFLRLAGRIDWRLFTAMLSPLLLILLLNTHVKTYLCMVEGFGLKPKNGMGAQKEHLASLLTLEGWQNLDRALSGQLWCLFSSTFGLAFWGLARCVKLPIRSLFQHKWGRHAAFYLFAMLASLGTFCVSAISLIDPDSITTLSSDTDLSYFIYTRYDECIIGILLLLGLLELAYCKKNLQFLKVFSFGIFLYAAFGIVLYFNLQRIEDTWHYRPFCVAGIGFYRLFSKEFSVLSCSLFAFGVGLVLILLLSFYKDKYRRLHIYAASILLACIFVPIGLFSAKTGTIASQRGKVSCGNLAMYRELGKVIGPYPVYCTLDNTKNFRIAYELQVNLINTKVYSITVEDLPTAEENYFICCSNGDLDRWEGIDYYLLAQSDSYAVVVKGTRLKEEIQPLASKEIVNLNDLE